jgi:glycolate oxidase iron-sulfur subunit
MNAPAASSPASSHFSAHDRPTWEMYSTCIHCGLCLNHCPTYKVLGDEADSPRGRIYQVLQADEGRLPLGESFVTHIDRCLGCLACETACPSGVHYGAIAERARAQIEQNYRRPLLSRFVRWFFYQHVLRNFKALKRLGWMLRLYQRSGLEKIVNGLHLPHLFGMGGISSLAPRIEDEWFFSSYGKVFPALGEHRAKVAFHAGCIANVAFAGLNRATVRLLTANGVEVHVPAAQQCCGALHAHSGLRDTAREQARRNIEAIRAEEFKAIITNAAGCGSTLKEYDDLLSSEPEYADSALEFKSKVRDISEFLAELGMREPKRKLGLRVGYQAACHLEHAQKVRSAPRELLRAIGCEVLELPHPDQCCGSAGSYNVTQTELSMKVLAAKMDDVASVQIDVIATGNVGCLLQLRAGMKQRNMHTPVKHIVELLDEAFG